jgi:hypothetical protein
MTRQNSLVNGVLMLSGGSMMGWHLFNPYAVMTDDITPPHLFNTFHGFKFQVQIKYYA